MSATYNEELETGPAQGKSDTTIQRLEAERNLVQARSNFALKIEEADKARRWDEETSLALVAAATALRQADEAFSAAWAADTIHFANAVDDMFAGIEPIAREIETMLAQFREALE